MRAFSLDWLDDWEGSGRRHFGVELEMQIVMSMSTDDCGRDQNVQGLELVNCKQ